MTIRSKQDLAVVLSKLKTFQEPSWQLEQYATPSEITADWIWQMALRSEVSDRVILDAACGPGILGLGLLLMGAKKIIFLDRDEAAMLVCMENYQELQTEYQIGEAEFIIEDIALFDGTVDVVVQNPPFGTKNEHIDKKFLEKAFGVAPIVYSMHKYSTRKFVEAVTKDHQFSITHLWRYEFPIKAAFAFHKKPVRVIDVGLWRMERS